MAENKESELISKILELKKDSRVADLINKNLLYKIYLHKNPTLLSEAIHILAENGLSRPQVSVPPKDFFAQTPLDDISLPFIYFGYEIIKENERKLYMVRFDYYNQDNQ